MFFDHLHQVHTLTQRPFQGYIPPFCIQSTEQKRHSMRLYIVGKTTSGEPHSINLGFEVLVEDRIEHFAQGRFLTHVEHPTKFVLVDAKGIRGVWTRTLDEAKAFKFPKFTRAAERYRGLCEESTIRELVVEPKEEWERDILRMDQTRK